MNEIDLAYATVHYQAPVVFSVFREGIQLDEWHVRELLETASKLSNNKPYLLLSDVPGFLSISSGARAIASSKAESPQIVANAVLINNLAIKLVANFFARYNQPHFAFKVFTDRKKAMDWLMTFDPQKS
jgi:hypothetical protein